MAMDLGNIVSLSSQIKELQAQISATSDPTVKALLQAQLNVATAQLNSEAAHMQAQADASNNLLNTMGLFATLTQVVGTQAPAIINLFK